MVQYTKFRTSDREKTVQLSCNTSTFLELSMEEDEVCKTHLIMIMIQDSKIHNS